MGENLKKTLVGLGMLAGVEGTAIPETQAHQDEIAHIQKLTQAPEQEPLDERRLANREEEESVSGQIKGLSEYFGENADIKVTGIDKHSKMVDALINGEKFTIEVGANGTFTLFSFVNEDAPSTVSTYDELDKEMRKKLSLRDWMESKGGNYTKKELQSFAHENYINLTTGSQHTVKGVSSAVYDAKVVGTDQLKKMRDALFDDQK